MQQWEDRGREMKDCHTPVTIASLPKFMFAVVLGVHRPNLDQGSSDFRCDQELETVWLSGLHHIQR